MTVPVKPSTFRTEARPNHYYTVQDIMQDSSYLASEADLKNFIRLDIVYRMLCTLLYNYAPLSGHPGGSISCGRIVANLVYNLMAYDFSDPDRDDADMLSYAAGHKALGLYAMSALRNEIVKTYAPSLLAPESRQLRLEDLLGFRKNPAAGTKLFKQFNSKPLDGHPVPLTPFVKLSTGASGVGVGSSVGLALAAAVAYKDAAPKVNIIEGEGGLTAGRSAEALAIASASGLDNIILHLDWNQASIDSDRVTAENGKPGDYAAWTPAELLYINGFNVIFVDNGMEIEKVYAAQKFAWQLKNGQPTAIVYRTVKGWHYGLEGKASHGSGHKFDSAEFYKTLGEFEDAFGVKMPRFCGVQTPDSVEECHWANLEVVRKVIKNNKELFEPFAKKIADSQKRLNAFARKPDAPRTEDVYAKFTPRDAPAQFVFRPEDKPTLRGVMADALAYIGKETGASMLVASADLGGSTGVSVVAKPYAKGFYNKNTNAESKLISGGGICEDGLSAVMSGVSAYGSHIGIAASYAAFTSSMMHTAARLHAIGQQCYEEATGKPRHTFIIFNGHAGIPTGEDGPTHADPQALQLIAEDFPNGCAITLTPLDANDIWPCLTSAFGKRPAVLYPTVTRPNVKVTDRAAIGADAAFNAKNGVYSLHKAKGLARGVIIIQGSGVGEIFVNGTLPALLKEGIELNVYYVTSRELFTALSEAEQEAILPPEDKKRAIAVTDFTLPTMYCWLKSEMSAKYSLSPFKYGKYMSSGKAPDVYKEARLDKEGQLAQIKEYLAALETGWK
jgi:transketolase